MKTKISYLYKTQRLPVCLTRYRTVSAGVALRQTGHIVRNFTIKKIQKNSGRPESQKDFKNSGVGSDSCVKRGSL